MCVFLLKAKSGGGSDVKVKNLRNEKKKFSNSHTHIYTCVHIQKVDFSEKPITLNIQVKISKLMELFALTACSRFQIPREQRAGLVLTNGQGYVFEQQLLECFLQLFPCPKLVFNLRVDWQRLRRAVIEPIRLRRRSTGDIADQTSDAITNEVDYAAVPVHRQNCFIGMLPTSSAAATTAVAAYVASPSAHAKRLRLSPQTNMRRSVPPTSAAASLQPALQLATTPKRFIRI